MATYQNVFLNGVGAAGSATFGPKGIEFRDQASQLRKTIEKEKILKSFITNYGNKGLLFIVLKDGKDVQLDGFGSEDLPKVKQQIENQYSVSCEKSEVCPPHILHYHSLSRPHIIINSTTHLSYISLPVMVATLGMWC